MQNLGKRLVLMLIRVGILVGVVVMVVVGVMVVAAVGLISFKKHLLVTEVECLGVDFWLVEGDMGGVFCCCSGGNGRGGFKVGGRSCCEASLGLFEWEDVLFVVFESIVF